MSEDFAAEKSEYKVVVIKLTKIELILKTIIVQAKRTTYVFDNGWTKDENMERRDWFSGYGPKQTNGTKIGLIINTNNIIWKLLQIKNFILWIKRKENKPQNSKLSKNSLPRVSEEIILNLLIRNYFEPIKKKKNKYLRIICKKAN